MKKKLDTRFPAARIKKIMQADEDVGKIAMAVPLLVSLEFFLQDLCDRTYDITSKKGVQTLNSFLLGVRGAMVDGVNCKETAFSHKTVCANLQYFLFSERIVSKVPDLGGSDAADEDHSVCRRRKVVDDDSSDCDDKPKRSRVDATSNNKRSRKGRGRVRGHGRRTVERETVPQHEKVEDEPNISYQQETNDLDLHRLDNERKPDELKESVQANNSVQAPVRKFDLNVGLDENGDSIIPVAGPPCPIKKTILEFKHEEYPGWPFSEIDKMGIDPTQLANFSGRIDEDEEDYDE